MNYKIDQIKMLFYQKAFHTFDTYVYYVLFKVNDTKKSNARYQIVSFFSVFFRLQKKRYLP